VGGGWAHRPYRVVGYRGSVVYRVRPGYDSFWTDPRET
jgi:hypothetical protein